MQIGMVVTDLDGTLLDAQHALSAADRRTLVELGERGIVRVIATGRSLFSARRVLPADLPIDYLVHTSGAGVVSWPEQRSLRATHMTAELASELVAVLVARGCDFMLHHAIPNNHGFYAHRSSAHNPDFDHRLRLYAPYASELRWPRLLESEMCQAVIIEPPGPSRHAELRAALTRFQVIRCTSPFDGASIWTEVFPPQVSKAAGAAWVRRQGSWPLARCIAIGNDYNDLDLLQWADRSYVVANAPSELRARYVTVASHVESGFSDAVRRALSAEERG
jgi:HAD superfamily hydrolase (TIGR01484 family)